MDINVKGIFDNLYSDCEKIDITFPLHFLMYFNKTINNEPYLLSIYVYKNNELYNIALTRDIIEYISNLYYYKVLDKGKYSIKMSMREECSGKTMNDEVSFLRKIESEIPIKMPLNFSQDLGENIYKINIPIKLRQRKTEISRKTKSNNDNSRKRPWSKLSSVNMKSKEATKTIKESKTLLKKQIAENEIVQNEVVEIKEDLIVLDSDKTYRYRVSYINRLLKSEDSKKYTKIYNIIAKKRNLIIYEPKTEDEINSWERKIRFENIKFYRNIK